MSLQSEFVATLVDEWARAGVERAVLSPGSRSAPLALALLGDRRITVDIRLDERSAAFFALGAALVSKRPVVIVTTSGTATAEVHAAVLEADRAGVPLIVCTADRPHELHQVGAPQTIDQRGLYGSALRYSCSPGIADDTSRSSWRSIGSRLVEEAWHGPLGPGPVHANLAFREPLTGAVDALPAGRPDDRPWHELQRAPACAEQAVARFLELVDGVERGVIVAGSGASGETDGGEAAVLQLAALLGWPVLAEPRAWPRQADSGASVLVAAGDQILRSEAVRRALRPDVVVHLGSIPTSKVLANWAKMLHVSGCRHVHVEPFGRFEDPDRLADVVLVADPGLLAKRTVERLRALPDTVPQAAECFASPWQRAERAAQEAIDAVLDADESLNEPWLARSLSAALPKGTVLVASASMPVRELEWFSEPRRDAARVLANRGVSGIDGVVSTVLGVASADREGPTVGLLGDLALFYDLSGLVLGQAEAQPKATLVVVDNGGGGIFSFLPYAGELDEATFERAFGTPQSSNLVEVVSALGCAVHRVERREDFVSTLATCLDEPGISVLVAHTVRNENVTLHETLEAHVASAVSSMLRA